MNRKIISSMYPSIKLGIAVLVIILSAFYDWKLSYLLVLPICMMLSLVDGCFKPFIKKTLVTLGVLVIIIFLFKFMLDQSEINIYIDLGIFQISEQGIQAGLKQTKVIISMVGALLLFFETTEMEDLMIALQKMHVSHVASYVMLSTMQMIPEMIKKSKIIMQAQQARGIETEGNLVRRAKAFFPSLGPLIISAVTETEERSITLEVRGFSSTNPKTALKIVEMKSSDKIILVFSVIIFILMMIWRFIR